MAKIIAGVSDLDAARQITRAREDAPDEGHWSLWAGGAVVATVRQDGPRVGVQAAADQEPLEPGEARRLALALLEHADRAEKAGG